MTNNTSQNLDITGAKEIIDDLAAAANQFDASIPLCANCSAISILSDAGFDTSSCSNYDANIKSLKETLFETSVSLRSYIETVEEADRKIEEEIPNEEEIIPEKEEEEATPAVTEQKDTVEELKDNTENPDGGTNTDGTSGTFGVQTTIPSTTPLKNPNRPGGSSNNNMDKLVEELEKYYNNISSESLQPILSNLYEEAIKYNVSLKELLSNDKYASVVLQAINKSKISSDIINKMNTLGIEKTKKIILNSLLGDNNVLGINKDSKEWMKKSLNNVALGKNLDIKELVKNKDAKLKDIVSEVKKYSKEHKYDSGIKMTNAMLSLDDTKLAYMISTLFI